MRLLCDEMLGGLARLLRAAGHDVELARRGQSDTLVLATARREGRLLVTRDRQLAERAGEGAVLLTADGVDAQARQLSVARPIDWLLAPFTRCVVDNAPLRPATKDERMKMPESVRTLRGDFNVCPRCGRLYWPGSHVQRLRDRLESLAGC